MGSSSLGCTGGSRHEPLGRPQDCAAFPQLAATFTREVAAGHLSVVVVQAIGKRRAGVAGMKLAFVNVVCTKPSFVHHSYRMCGRGMSHSLAEQVGCCLSDGFG